MVWRASASRASGGRDGPGLQPAHHGPARGSTVRPGEWYQLAVATRERPDELIGDLAFSPDADDPATARIGFTPEREAQGRGYCTVAVRALLTYLFEARGKRRVAADYDPRNARSIALLERVGFTREGEIVEAY